MSNPQITDQPITSKQIQNLKSAEEIAKFFDMLGYPVDERIEMTPESLNFSDDLRESVQRIEKISSVDEELEVYLVEMLSVTVARRKALARSFRDFPMEFLFVLTDDFNRIDFMLLERKIPAYKDFGIGKRKALIHHHTFSVDRTKPDQVALRILRRFSFTAYDQQGERDPLGQYDKLKSAFTAARWSEPYFNNRALFSDYYLTERLPDHPAWDAEDRHQVFRGIRAVYANAGSLAGKDRQSLQRELIVPVLEELEFAVENVGSPKGPDLKLFSDGNMNGEQLAFALCYPWNRYLDGRDAGGTDPERGDENPGAVMVGLLEEGTASWGILTNGKIWRLYSAGAHSRATNYYEINLEEALASQSPGKAFRYFYLFFRAEAFIPQEQSLAGETCELSFLDLLLEESDLYARQLGDRLKDTVFEEIFPYFAEGFIEGMGGTETLLELPEEEREEKLKLVYRGTLTFLYRLLFLLYAESRDLLPAREVRGYYKNSLQRIKEEIATKAGNIEDLATENIRKAYDKTETGLYDRFSKLCRIVDEGSPGKNVPVYNGGLFLTDPGRARNQRDKEISSFLIEYPIPDQFFALGLDKMARDIDSKKHALGFIDYKSLGVRQLGSIYEGLLEFKVLVAAEKMAVVKGKKTEEIVSYKEAKEESFDILTEGRGQNAKERVTPRGEVYLVNDKQERKATGSYYTPDYIVKYIVEHAVGPVMDEKLEKLQPRLQETERKYRALLKRKREVEGVEPDPYRLLKANFGEVILDLFDIKVLDPAMGSGHFLVEAVDYITDRLVRFLDRYPFLSVFFEGMKETILNELSDQGVAAYPELLTDVNLLKRHVLKRCIYGVDLNPMAVELAKVSLWLDCFTLGAPLSFLDHHLKCGNSLIGAMARELDEEDNRQMTFLTGPFAGLLRAAEIMRGVSLLTDVTLSQVRESGELYREYEEKAKPFKDLLDIYISQHFGVELAEEFLSVHDQDEALQMIKGETDTPDVYVDVIDQAKHLNNQKHFFHWDLEYPEVFIGLSSSKWKKDGGFDVVIGNPPYDVIEKDRLKSNNPYEDFSQFLKDYDFYEAASGGKQNLFRHFLVLVMNLINPNGNFGQVVPLAILADSSCSNTLKAMLNKGCNYEIQAFPQKDIVSERVFPEAKLSTCIIIGIDSNNQGLIKVNTNPGRFIREGKKEYSTSVDELNKVFKGDKYLPLANNKEWQLIKNLRLDSMMISLDDIVDVSRGEINQTIYREYIIDDPDCEELLKGSQIQKYREQAPSQGSIEWFNNDLYEEKTGERKESPKERIALQRITGVDDARRLTGTLITRRAHFADSLNSIECKDNDRKLKYVLALLNSKLLNWCFGVFSTNNNVSVSELIDLPIMPANFVKTNDASVEESFTARSSLLRKNKEELLAEVDRVLSRDLSSRTVSLLVNLVGGIRKMYMEKQALIEKFWTNIEKVVEAEDFIMLKTKGKWEQTLARDEACLPYIDPQSRATIHLNESLGWNENAFRAFAGMLIGKTSVTPSMIEVYRKHAPEYQELTHQIEETDDLIDQIVYRLYGLTDEEIEIVESSFED